ncbi:Probable 2-oxoglutarate-dependent dioxygenase [Seminavis robusta]|uniref:Probable 2-oxoglutarate-dependent dioxygenase n=1 Tax=Seminavis robusta TaxID=568900 RepID=A0A9N8DVA9_9STRA|nr:Probable 2-oxoglutarate-dependent dioxygenase [Seminavis robusta]|eukprot:Sro302_g112250.1 Probable 2-oxoglutarate-dependent dioxygenase (354) ;mRNA; r:56925-57986
MQEEKRIPVIDLSAWTQRTPSAGGTTSSDDERRGVVELVGKACTSVGFFAITNHGVNSTRLESLWQSARDFFDLPAPVKLQSKTNNETEYPYGYEQSETLVVGKQLDQGVKSDSLLPPPDQKETFSLGPNNPLAGMPPRRFPSQPPELQEALEEYFQEMEHLATTLLEIFALALDLPQDWFQNKMTRHMSALRLLNYFATDKNASADDKTEIVRAGAHSDYGALTILKAGGPGLQVKWKDGEWVHVPFMEDSFVVNLGDLMQRWTNDKWVSTLHRVVVVPTSGADGGAQRRQSIAYFCNVNGDTPVETLPTCIDEDHPLKYPKVLAKDHLMAKHLASMRHGEPSEKADGHDEL